MGLEQTDGGISAGPGCVLETRHRASAVSHGVPVPWRGSSVLVRNWNWDGLLLLFPAPPPPSPGQAQAPHQHGLNHCTSRLRSRRKLGVDEVVRIPGTCSLCLAPWLGSPAPASPELQPAESDPPSPGEPGSPDPRVVLAGTMLSALNLHLPMLQIHVRILPASPDHEYGDQPQKHKSWFLVDAQRPGLGQSKDHLSLQKPICQFLEGPGGRQVDHEPAVCPGCQESSWDPGVHQEECGQQVEGGSPPPLHYPSEAPSAVLCPVLGSPARER